MSIWHISYLTNMPAAVLEATRERVRNNFCMSMTEMKQVIQKSLQLSIDKKKHIWNEALGEEKNVKNQSSSKGNITNSEAWSVKTRAKFKLTSFFWGRMCK